MSRSVAWWATAIIIGMGLALPMGASAEEDVMEEGMADQMPAEEPAEAPQEVSLMPQPQPAPLPEPAVQAPPPPAPEPAAEVTPEIVSPPPPQALTGKQHWNGTRRKLGRGLANILTCPLEMIREPYLTERKEGYVAAWTVGMVRGVGSTLVRAGAGVYETLTFVLPNGAAYDPILKPEFVYRGTDWVE